MTRRFSASATSTEAMTSGDGPSVATDVASVDMTHDRTPHPVHKIYEYTGTPMYKYMH